MHKSGLLLVDCHQIVVPRPQRQDILKVIHQAHPGLQRSLSLAAPSTTSLRLAWHATTLRKMSLTVINVKQFVR
jgi:hypothetical protein